LKGPVVAHLLSWQIWAITFLIIIVVWLFEASFRIYRRAISEADVAEAETDAAKTELHRKLSLKIQISIDGNWISEDTDSAGVTTKRVQFVAKGKNKAPLVNCEALIEQVYRLGSDSQIQAKIMEEPLRCEWSNTSGDENFEVQYPTAYSSEQTYSQ
jgi:hypothetical protein